MEEIFDIYTQDGTPTGKTAARSKAHREALWHRTAHIWVYNPEHGLLIQKRAANKESHPSLWDISAAGHVPAGEKVLDAAIRECEEEIGIHFPADVFETIGERLQVYDFPENAFYDREIVTIYLIRSSLSIDAFRAQAEEVEELAYITLTKLEKAVRLQAKWLIPHWDEYEKVLSFLNS